MNNARKELQERRRKNPSAQPEIPILDHIMQGEPYKVVSDAFRDGRLRDAIREVGELSRAISEAALELGGWADCMSETPGRSENGEVDQLYVLAAMRVHITRFGNWGHWQPVLALNRSFSRLQELIRGDLKRPLEELAKLRSIPRIGSGRRTSVRTAKIERACLELTRPDSTLAKVVPDFIPYNNVEVAAFFDAFGVKEYAKYNNVSALRSRIANRRRIPR